MTGQSELASGLPTPIDELKTIVLAAADGKVRETVWIGWGAIIQSQATIDLAGGSLGAGRVGDGRR